MKKEDIKGYSMVMILIIVVFALFFGMISIVDEMDYKKEHQLTEEPNYDVIVAHKKDIVLQPDAQQVMNMIYERNYIVDDDSDYRIPYYFNTYEDAQRCKGNICYKYGLSNYIFALELSNGNALLYIENDKFSTLYRVLEEIDDYWQDLEDYIANMGIGSSLDDRKKLEVVAKTIALDTQYSNADPYYSCPYAILKEGFGQCVAYTMLFNDICFDLGIYAIDTTGYVSDSDSGHMWSICRINGQDYFCDITGYDGEIFGFDDFDEKYLFSKNCWGYKQEDINFNKITN